MLDDADIEKVVEGVMLASFFNTGQVCTEASRLLVPSELHDRIAKEIGKRASKLRLGDPFSDPDLGPLTTKEQLQKVLYYSQLGKEEGANLEYGGYENKGYENKEKVKKGFYFPPTVFSNVRPDMRIAQEEIFGPVLCIIPYEGVDEAIDIANGTPYGLAGAVCSTNIERAMDVAREMRCGRVWINTYHVFPPDAPFGGYKESGIGREHGIIGLREYQEIKHIIRG